MKSGRAAIPQLQVLDRLEVGAPVIEPRRLTARYTVEQQGRTDSIDLIYRYEEDVFDDDDASRNLASMIAAQLALNYGLFCKRLVFAGSFDERDRRFLGDFAENTAREIYVNKLLRSNPFLTGPARDLAPLALDRYTQAEPEFSADVQPATPSGPRSATGTWNTDPSKHAVLSSGGKDSLLSLGILNELGRATHPLFVNESGRHWYTALNSYRHLSATQPSTSRVWTNSDRVFSWMLRHLPFVRPDFPRVRADEYPIRLWTVAVFSFGVLPLLRRRGIGRLLVGDEYDTTAPGRYKGISHYNGLFDQSRYFDDAMSRYFGDKRWGVCQFSILRQMSELLIQKTLAERYPALLGHQVSCHAAHVEGSRVLPCGRCEKCRRIVGMLMALDADPARCGYSKSQIDACLHSLAAHGVHQETVGAQQLAYMLDNRGLLDGTAKSAGAVREHPEVLSLRFHRSRSPMSSMPVDLRDGVYRILLDHARGALLRSGRMWIAYDALGADLHASPYPFEPRGSRGKHAAAADDDRYLLGELTWPVAEARFKQVDVALLPVGAIEQHGPHLPLDTDAFDADYLARRVAEGCSRPRPLVLPLLPYGVSYHHDDFSGTISVNPETQSRLVYEIGMAVARCGITKLVMINGHGGNGPALHLAAQMINRDAHIFTCVDTGETSDADIHDMIETADNDVHAGEIETSTSLAVRPELVDMRLAPRLVPRFSSRYLDFTSKRGVGWYAYTNRISSNGVMGDATLATADKGRRMWEVMTRRLVELVEDLKRLSLDEIHQRRY